MPIIKGQHRGKNPLKQSFVDRVRSGNVIPILSDEAMADLVLTGRNHLIEGYADYVEYPMDDRNDPLRIAKFKAIAEDLEDYDLKFDFLNFFKNHLYYMAESEGMDADGLEEAAAEVDNLGASAFAARLGYPKLDNGMDDPLLILADLPLPIYLTTSPHTFMESALEKAGKQPATNYCRWHPGLTDDSQNHHIPTREQPLVFHLFGLDTEPSSLLLTEGDYLQFLVAISQNNGKDTDPIPSQIRRAISTSALVLLGFELASWAFRVLFWGLIKPATMTHRGICCLQLVPTEIEKQFLQDYLRRDADFEVYWGDVKSYTQELNRMYRG